MKEIDTIVKDFVLSGEDEGALMITGEWGVGKTYYFFNTLMPLLEEMKFEPIYISLNGVSSQEQIRKLLLSKAISKEGSKLQKILSKSSKLDFLVSIFDISDLVKLEGLVFCFDDLERISQDYRIEDVLGFINSEFVEQKRAKVILIGDDTKRQLASSDYSRAKEKLISRSVQYIPDIENIIRSLLRSGEEEFVENDSLVNQQELILKLVTGFDCKNIRTIKFYLKILRKIFESCHVEVEGVLRDIGRCCMNRIEKST